MVNETDIYNEDCIAGAARFEDNSVDLIICDPPFGINEGKFGANYKRDSNHILPGYVEAPDDYYQFTYDWLTQAKRILKPDGTIYLISSWNNLGKVLRAVAKLELIELNHIIWKYSFGVATKRKFVSSHYHILRLGKIKQPKFNTNCRFTKEDRKNNRSLLYADMEDVWMIKKEYHPGTIKNINKLPDALISKIIQYSSDEGDIVCDFFMGNFTTAHQALKLNRIPIGFELNKAAFEQYNLVLQSHAKVNLCKRID